MQEVNTQWLAVEQSVNHTSPEEEVALDDWPDIVWDYLVVSETEWEEEYAQAS